MQCQLPESFYLPARVIVADRKIDCTHLLGQFLDASHYDVLVEEDCDAYGPPGMTDEGLSEDRVLFKFRKGFFSQKEQNDAFDGLFGAAHKSHNRGIAAGLHTDDSIMNIVTPYQYEVFDALSTTSALHPIPDLVDEIREKYARNPDRNVSQELRQDAWLKTRVDAEKFDFEAWVDRAKFLGASERMQELRRVQSTLISSTVYAMEVHSGVVGFYDRYPRIPYCREVSYSRDYPDRVRLASAFLEKLNCGFHELLPQRWGAQKAACDRIDSRFVLPNTVFTTLTVNKTFRTAAHLDAGDYGPGFSNLCVISDGKKFSGGYLVFPEYRVAVNVRPGDLLLVANHTVIHGNTPIMLDDPEASRISVVAYFREGLLAGGSKEYEDARRDFVTSRKENRDHSLWRPFWNGVSPGMWESDEWYTYLRKKPEGEAMLQQYHPEISASSSSIEEFFA